MVVAEKKKEKNPAGPVQHLRSLEPSVERRKRDVRCDVMWCDKMCGVVYCV